MKNPNIIFIAILFGLVCFGPARNAQALAPAPDGGYIDGDAAKAHAAVLPSFTESSYDIPVGLFSVSSNASDNFNTAVGAGVLRANASAENTASGAGTRLSDAIVFLLLLPWLVRALASAKAIWQALTGSEKSESEKESCALAGSRC